MKPYMYLKYDFLLDFTGTKALAASLVKGVEAAVKGQPNMLLLSICPTACDEELCQAKTMREILLKFLQYSNTSYSEFQTNSYTISFILQTL